MAKFQITHANNAKTQVEAGWHELKNGYFDFLTRENGVDVQVLTIRETAVLKIEKID